MAKRSAVVGVLVWLCQALHKPLLTHPPLTSGPGEPALFPHSWILSHIWSCMPHMCKCFHFWCPAMTQALACRNLPCHPSFSKTLPARISLIQPSTCCYFPDSWDKKTWECLFIQPSLWLFISGNHYDYWSRDFTCISDFISTELWSQLLIETWPGDAKLSARRVNSRAGLGLKV